MKIWKIYDLENSEKIKIEVETITLNGPAWRVSWSLTGSILAVSSACTETENSI